MRKDFHSLGSCCVRDNMYSFLRFIMTGPAILSSLSLQRREGGAEVILAPSHIDILLASAMRNEQPNFFEEILYV